MLLPFQGPHHSKKENEDNAPVGHASLYSISEELGNLVALSLAQHDPRGFFNPDFSRRKI